jgi:hypothetical protein
LIRPAIVFCVSPSFTTGHSVRKSLLDLLSHWTLTGTRSWGHKRPRTILNGHMDDVGRIMDTLGHAQLPSARRSGLALGTRGKTHVERTNKVKVLFCLMARAWEV